MIERKEMLTKAKNQKHSVTGEIPFSHEEHHPQQKILNQHKKGTQMF